jgi:6-pyruvoyltetrahydropterin/6-carboxytetrahydropterin synthase
MLITRKIDFSASHVCANPAWSEDRNREVYGEDARPHGHGHNYVLEVTLEGEPDPATGMVIDLKRVKDILEEEVMRPIDHRHLNCEVPPFNRVVPTTENLAIEIWRRLDPRFEGNARLKNVRLYETEDLYVDFEGREV